MRHQIDYVSNSARVERKRLAIRSQVVDGERLFHDVKLYSPPIIDPLSFSPAAKILREEP